MLGKALTTDDILNLLKDGKKDIVQQPKNELSAKEKIHPRFDDQPLGVLLQSQVCSMCNRGEGRKANTRAMYTVDNTPLCLPHACYVLSMICLDNGYEVQVACKVPVVELPGQL